MKWRIFKYTLPYDREFTINMPFGARVLSVQTQNGAPMLWAMIDPEAEPEPRAFWQVGTGDPFDYDKPGRYIGTYQLSSGTFVFHIFEQTPGE